MIFFSGQWIRRRGRIERAARSLDLLSRDFLLGGRLTIRSYETQLTSLNQLRQRITNECQQITAQMLQNVSRRIEQNLFHCMKRGGG